MDAKKRETLVFEAQGENSVAVVLGEEDQDGSTTLTREDVRRLFSLDMEED